MAQLKSNTQTKLDVKADIDINNEVVQLPVGAAAEVVSARPKAAKRADGTWLEALGEGQTWQDMTASRANNVIYTNTTGKPIILSIRGISSISISQYIYVDGSLVVYATLSGGTNWGLQLPNVVVPNGSTYRHTIPSGTVTWWELR